MTTVVIIPVKSFSKAKTRLELPISQKTELCEIMLKEVLGMTISSPLIEEIVVVSKDESVQKICKEFAVNVIIDEKEIGVNNAVSLADDYLSKKGIDTSIVFPQDIPLIQESDIENLIQFQKLKQSVLIVPSQRFDGTNALVRTPFNIMKTHYDEDSYKIHLATGKSLTENTSLVLIRRIMMDIDNLFDLKLLLEQNEKPSLCEKIKKLLL